MSANEKMAEKMARTFSREGSRVSVEMNMEQFGTLYAAAVVASLDTNLSDAVRADYAALAQTFSNAPIVGLAD